MHSKPIPTDSSLDLAPHSITIERQGRHLKVGLDRIPTKTTLRNFYTPIRLFRMSRFVFQLQHLLYMVAMDLTITYKVPGVLIKAKKLKNGHSLHFL